MPGAPGLESVGEAQHIRSVREPTIDVAWGECLPRVPGPRGGGSQTCRGDAPRAMLLELGVPPTVVDDAVLRKVVLAESGWF